MYCICIITRMPCLYTRSVSIHHYLRPFVPAQRSITNVSNILNELRRCLPYVSPCYAVTPKSSPQLLSYLNQHNVSLIKCLDRQLTVDGPRPYTEHVVRHVSDIARIQTPRPPSSLWIKTDISSEGIERSRELFEYIWENKCILNGIVFDIHNFMSGYIPPSMYNYKVATDYVFRNIILPFQHEYGIQTPAIIIDGQDHITQLRHLSELHNYALKETSIINGFIHKKPELRLILGSLIDSCSCGGGGGGGDGGRIRVLATHEYP